MKVKIVLFPVLGFLISFCSSHNQNEDWIKFKSIEGNFEIMVPDKPSLENNRILHSPKYGEIPYSQYVFHEKQSDSIHYSAQYCDYPDFHFNNDTSRIDTFYDESSENIISLAEGTIAYNATINFKGYRGREYLVTTLKKQKLLVRSFIIGERHYILMVYFHAIYLENNSHIYKFLNSFALLNNSKE